MLLELFIELQKTFMYFIFYDNYHIFLYFSFLSIKITSYKISLKLILYKNIFYKCFVRLKFIWQIFALKPSVTYVSWQTIRISPQEGTKTWGFCKINQINYNAQKYINENIKLLLLELLEIYIGEYSVTIA